MIMRNSGRILDKTPSTDLFETQDLALAAALKAIKYDILSVKNDAGHGTFTFKDSAVLQESILLFFNRKLMVSALDYFNEVRNLKNMLYHN